MTWIRNEWFWDGYWVQDRKHLCMIDEKTTEPAMREVVDSWKGHIWLMGDGYWFGIPKAEGFYLILFKEVR